MPATSVRPLAPVTAASPHPAAPALTGVASVAPLIDHGIISGSLDISGLEVVVSRENHQVVRLFQEMIRLNVTLLHGELPRIDHVVVVATLPIATRSLIGQRNICYATRRQLCKFLCYRLIKLLQNAIPQFLSQFLR